jgi:cell shape-determining protein MreC
MHRKPYGLFLNAELEPSVDFRRLEEVFVILDQKKVPASEDFETGGDVLFPASGNP